MSNQNFEKLPTIETDGSITLNINTTDYEVEDTKHEVVYRSTTMDKEEKWQSLKSDLPKNTFFLYRTAFSVYLLAFTVGIGFSWTSPVLPKLFSPSSPLKQPIDGSQASIIASILPIGAAIGPFFVGHLADKIGRKKTLIAAALPIALADILIAFTDDVRVYYLGRLITGISSGGILTVFTMYLGEITTEFNRGKISCCAGIFLALGILYPFSFGSFLSVKLFTLSCMLPLLMFLIMFSLYAPDSPSYLIASDQPKEAQNAIKKLQGLTKDEAIKKTNELRSIIEKEKQEKGGIVELFRDKGCRKGFLIISCMFLMQQFSGINPLTAFLEHILVSTGSSISPQFATIGIGIIQVITVFVTSSVIDKLGRKQLLLYSMCGSSIALTMLGSYFFLLRNRSQLIATFWWMPIFSLVLFFIAFNLGIGPVPWTVLSEIFPNNVKSSAASLASASNFAISFVVTLAFPIINKYLGMAESFWLFGGCCVLGAIFLHFVMIETKGKNATEIQAILSK